MIGTIDKTKARKPARNHPWKNTQIKQPTQREAEDRAVPPKHNPLRRQK